MFSDCAGKRTLEEAEGDCARIGRCELMAAATMPQRGETARKEGGEGRDCVKKGF